MGVCIRGDPPWGSQTSTLVWSMLQLLAQGVNLSSVYNLSVQIAKVLQWLIKRANFKGNTVSRSQFHKPKGYHAVLVSHSIQLHKYMFIYRKNNNLSIICHI